jgi:Trypsin
MAGALPDSPAARIDPNTSQSRWSGAVCVLNSGAPFSGTLISSQHVIAAAHVTSGTNPGPMQCVFNLDSGPVTIAVSQVVIYPTASFPYDDLAILTLAQPAPAAAKRYPVVDTALPTGTQLSLVGYGGSGQGPAGTSIGGSATIKRAGKNTVDVLTNQIDASGRSGAFYVFDFDGPLGNGALGGPSLGNDIETGVASGDSGSGAYFLQGGTDALYAVNVAALQFASTPLPAGAFGTGGAGLVLSHPPYLQWIQAQTQQSVMLLSRHNTEGDVPLPAWALAAMGVGCAAAMRKRYG